MDGPRTAADVATLKRRIRVARGEEAGDLVLVGGRVVNVLTREILPANVVIADGYIAGVGEYDWEAAGTVQVEGQFILPGLIDSHMHVESTLLLPAELARVVVPHGTTAVVADPHEIGNVLGIPGIEMLIAASEGLPLDIFFMAPSCVPAAPFEHAGAVLDSDAVARLLQNPRILGLAEMMNFPGVLAADDEVVRKLACAHGRKCRVDGHAPGLVGQDLVAYAAAGIRSDHESMAEEEALAKARLGMLVQVREGSSARNLDTLLPLIRDNRISNWCLCTDDIHPDDLLQHGHLDAILRRLVAGGVPAIDAVRHASLVPACHYGFSDRGAIAPGYRADVVIVDDLTEFPVRLVVQRGEIAARDGEYVAASSAQETPVPNTVNIASLSESDFRLKIDSDQCHVIGLIPDQIVTKKEQCVAQRKDGVWSFDPDQDITLVASIERHKASGQIGLGLVRGFGLKRGALGSSVAHDSHNLVIAGTNAQDMLCCARALQETGGGFVAAADGTVLAQLPLPVAGLLSTNNASVVANQLDDVHAAAASLGCPLPSPFGTLSFLALSVIPELRITDQGMFDVFAQQLLAY